jgi:hypothetical protein
LLEVPLVYTDAEGMLEVPLVTEWIDAEGLLEVPLVTE